MGTERGVEELLQGISFCLEKASKITGPPAASMLPNMTTLVSGREGGPSPCSCQCLGCAEAQSAASSRPSCTKGHPSLLRLIETLS